MSNFKILVLIAFVVIVSIFFGILFIASDKSEEKSDLVTPNIRAEDGYFRIE